VSAVQKPPSTRSTRIQGGWPITCRRGADQVGTMQKSVLDALARTARCATTTLPGSGE